MTTSKIIYAVINPNNNTFCSAWDNEQSAQNDADHSIKEYKLDRAVISGTVSEIAEATGSEIEAVIKFL